MFDVDDRTPNEHDAYPDCEEDSFDPVSAEEELATLSAHLDAATYRQLVLIRLLDERGHWSVAATGIVWSSTSHHTYSATGSSRTSTTERGSRPKPGDASRVTARSIS